MKVTFNEVVNKKYVFNMVGMGILWLALGCRPAFSATSALDLQSVINAEGSTHSSVSLELLDTMGEALCGQIWGSDCSIQLGFINDYFVLPSTPTVTSTVTVTCTPIRTFNGEILDEDWVYAAPNPVRSINARLVFHIAETAEVEIKIFTTSNQLVISKHWGSLPAGENHWSWNTSGVANGVYLVLVKAKGSNSGRITMVKKKIALVR